MTMNMPIQRDGPSLAEMEQKYVAAMNRIPNLNDDARQSYMENWNRFVRGHLAARVVRGNGMMREGDWKQLDQMIYQRDPNSGVHIQTPLADFIDSIAQHYSGPNDAILRQRLKDYYNHHVAKRAAATPPANHQTSVGTSDSDAFAA